MSVIIPTLNAEVELPQLIAILRNQTCRPDEIIIIDSESRDATRCIAKEAEGVSLIEILRKDFDHGGTRHKAFLRSSGDFVLFLTQDAVPSSERYIESLLLPFSDERVAMSSGRQLPKKEARRFEQLVREFNYPAESNVRSSRDIPKYGIKTFFASDVCSAYRRTAYLQCGGFAAPCNTNEDMLMAATFVHAGYKVAYEASATVYHSHNLSAREQYLRNKEIGFFLEENSENLCSQSEIGEGGRLAKEVLSQLLREFRPMEAFLFAIDCCARLLGNRAGKRAYIKTRETR